MANVVVYSAEMCGDCQKLKAYMDEQGIEYETRDIKKNPEYGKELEEKTGKLGVPYLVIDGEWVRGYQPGQPFSKEFADSLFAGAKG
jgi:glutaredoxin-like protein NrdH